MRIGRFTFSDGRPTTAEIEVRDVEVATSAIAFHGVQGLIHLDGNALTLSSFEGAFGKGRVFDVSGVLPLKLDRMFRCAAAMPSTCATSRRSRLRPESRPWEGPPRGYGVEGRQGQGFRIEGAGALHNGRFTWKQIDFGARGRFTFRDTAVTFAPLVISEAGTHLTIEGLVAPRTASVRISGTVDGRQLGRLAGARHPVGGLAGVEGEIGTKEGEFHADGRIWLTGLSFEVPNILRKEEGLVGAAEVSLGQAKGGGVRVERLKYTLGALEGTATVRSAGRASATCA